jgi:hypothetical protein
MSIRASQVTCLLRGLVVALLTTGAAFANDEVALPAVIVGRFVFHCHVTKHEDKGMTQTIDVEEPRSREVSSGALP